MRDPMSSDVLTLATLFLNRVAVGGDLPALAVPAGEGAFRTLSWNDLAAEVRRMAAALARLGIHKHDRVAQVSENRLEWIVVDLATHLLGAVHVAIHAALSGNQIAWQIADAKARLLLVSGAEQAAKLAGSQPPSEVPCYSFDPVQATVGGAAVTPLATLLEAIDPNAAEALAVQHDAARRAAPDDLATILYTSGTTGEAKGVMLSHANLVSNAQAACQAFDVRPDDVRLCWLPLSHIFARTCDLYTWLASGGQLALAESRERIIANCQTLRPMLINGVPYFFDKVRQHLQRQPGGPAPGQLAALLGGRVRLCCSGGAALSDATAEFFWQQGVPLVQGYGLTETSPVISVATPQQHKLGTVGRAISGVEIRIAADGEILTRGPHVMIGYWKRPEDTAQTIRDGWLHTGDLGTLDEDGFLRITGRKKELIVTAAGKNVAPVYLESLLVEDPLIAQAVVVGEGRNYLTALIVPDPDGLRAEILARQIPVRSPEEALVHPQVLELYRQRIDQRLAGVARYEQVGKFALVGRAFSLEQGELTPTLKLRRAVVLAHFAPRIEAMYAEQTS